MKLLPCSSVPIGSLIGALAINPHGMEYSVLDVRLSLDTLKVQLVLSATGDSDDTVNVDYDSLSDWQLQLGNRS